MLITDWCDLYGELLVRIGADAVAAGCSEHTQLVIDEHRHSGLCTAQLVDGSDVYAISCAFDRKAALERLAVLVRGMGRGWQWTPLNTLEDACSS
jgi:hypothetical protein